VLQFYDAHNHLADPSLKDEFGNILRRYDAINLNAAIVVGTAPGDWEQVLSLAASDCRLIPAVGLHPWQANQAPADWQSQMLACLDRGAKVIGEIGLDQWVEGHDLERQLEAFRWQFALAAERNLPTSIHCLKAHQPLLETLHAIDKPARGFKVHAYNGPVATIHPLLDLGAYFSFNAGQLKPNAKRILEIISQVPDDRILVETDAPDFLPPESFREFELHDPNLNHPANLRSGYAAIAEIRRVPLESFAGRVAQNFNRYFLSQTPQRDANA